ncbi:hypothetical protein P171DRAFT_439812 [Karstenula rhodostoma CBS 690.94]|uniref:Mid2 domain-containing protein n=1 Tax=Karstenula rhodostoma CBS 690.94 TaxID=1392251 RepID=A0A9P4UH61_9PLEO|nr:hypothetical protein P171DRAFT_439812 [Karstenula rhodostoma CBS 690.94]
MCVHICAIEGWSSMQYLKPAPRFSLSLVSPSPSVPNPHARSLYLPLLAPSGVPSLHYALPDHPSSYLTQTHTTPPKNIIPHRVARLSRVMLLHTLLLPAFAALLNADCYSHDGIKALDSKYYRGPELVSCGNGTDNCCLVGEKCGTNLLCINGSGGVSRQYCDNAAWIGCSDACTGNVAAGVSIYDCGENIYCCGVKSDEACCTDERAFFVDPDDGGVTQTTAAAKTKKPRWFEVDSSSILASASRDWASLTTSSPSASTSSPASSTASLESSSVSSIASSAIATPTEPAKDSSGMSAGAGAGIGIGAAAGVALIGALVWYILRKKKQNTSRGVLSETSGHPVAKSGPQPTELGSGNYASHELDGSRPRHELDGSVAHAPKMYPGL